MKNNENNKKIKKSNKIVKYKEKRNDSKNMNKNSEYASIT